MAMAVARAAKSSRAVMTMTRVFGEIAQSLGQHFQAGYAVHPDVSHDYWHMMSAGVRQKIFRFIERANLESFGRRASNASI